MRKTRSYWAYCPIHEDNRVACMETLECAASKIEFARIRKQFYKYWAERRQGAKPRRDGFYLKAA